MSELFKYETHLHTREGSACASCSGKEYVDKYLKLGYAGIIVTDHFFNGNCAISNDIPWEDRVELFCKGYEEAKKEGDKKGLQVMFGWESNYDCDEYLIYGLDKKWLLKHPEVMEWDQKEQYQNVKKAGGLVVQAHPFRERDYIERINLHPYQSDAVEVCNAGNRTTWDATAMLYGRRFKKPITAGSDIHRASSVAFGCYGVAFDTPLENVADYVKRIKAGSGYKIMSMPERQRLEEGYRPSLPIYLFDKDNIKQEISFENLLSI